MKKVPITSKTILYPMPAVLVGAMVEGRPNFMTVAWCGIASHEPPAISLALQRSRYTLKGILEERAFSVNIPSSRLVKEVDFCGLYSGKETDKSKVFRIFYGKNSKVPMVEDCPVNLECSLMTKIELGSHILIVGMVEEVLVDEDCLVDGKIDPFKVDPIIYATQVRQYLRLGPPLARAFKVGKELKRVVEEQTP